MTQDQSNSPSQADQDACKEDLEWVRDEALRRMDTDQCTDQNFVMLGKLVIDAWKSLNVLQGEQTSAPKVGKLSDFQRKLADRRATA